jgi:hypothetical protein
MLSGKFELKVFDIYGQKLKTILFAKNKAKIEIDKFVPGMYLIVCYRDDVKIGTVSFIKN